MVKLNYSYLQKKWEFKYISNDDKDLILYNNLIINKKIIKFLFGLLLIIKLIINSKNLLKKLKISNFVFEIENDSNIKTMEFY